MDQARDKPVDQAQDKPSGDARDKPVVVVLGGINMDLVAVAPRFPEDGESVVGTGFLTYAGGKGANQAVAAARMGAHVKMVGRVGRDRFGSELLESLSASGVDVSGVEADPDASSGVATISIDASAQNRIIQIPGANATCGDSEVRRAMVVMEDASVLMLQLELPLEVSVGAAREAAAMGKMVILDPGPALPLPHELYASCSYITPNETEAQTLAGFPVLDVASAEVAARELLSRGVGCAVLKLGALGACYTAGSRVVHVPGFPVDAVDTVAAGDAFNAALAVALAEGRSVEESMRWAAAAGALAVTTPGAQDSMPWRHEVEAFLTSRMAS